PIVLDSDEEEQFEKKSNRPKFGIFSIAELGNVEMKSSTYLWSKVTNLLQQEKYSNVIDEIVNSIGEISTNRTKFVELLIICLNNLQDFKYLQKVIKACCNYLYPGEMQPILNFVGRLP